VAARRVSIPAPSVQLHCHHCSTWLGESRESLTFVGMFKDPRERERVPQPRDTYRCKRCGWVNVFQATDAAVRDWRADVEIKKAS
jgi:hypothetical protein